MTTPGNSSNPDEYLQLWYDKINHLQRELLLTSDAEKKFEISIRIIELEKQIEKIKQKRLLNQASRQDLSLNDPRDKGKIIGENQQIIGLRFIDVDHSYKDRVDELARLKQMVGSEKAKFICVVGRGGIGKTALISKLCSEIETGAYRLQGTTSLSHVGANGIIYFSFQSSGHVDVERLISAFYQILDTQEREQLTSYMQDARFSIEDKIRFLFSKLSSGRYLLVIDNFENVLTADDFIEDADFRSFIELCLSTPHGVTIIASSRRLVRLNQVQPVRVLKLDQGIPEKDGISMLRELDPDGNLGLIDAPEEILRSTVNKCFGIPRALEIISGILYSDQTLTIADIISNENLFNREVLENLVAEHYKLVTKDQLLVMEALAIYDEPVSKEAVQYLLHSFFPRVNVQENLQVLVRNSFVYHHRGSETYFLHPIDRQHINAHRVNKGKYTIETSHQKAAEYYLLLPQVDNPSDLSEIENQLKARQHFFEAREYEKAGEIARRYGRLLNRWGYYKTVDKILDETIQTTQNLLLANAYLGKTSIYSLQNNWVKALEFNKLAIETVIGIDSAEEKDFVCYAKINLCYIYTRLAQFQNALEVSRETLALSQQLENKALHSRSLSTLALAELVIGNYTDAYSAAQQCIDLSRELPSQDVGSSIAHSYDIMAKSRFETGDAHAALQYYGQALELRQKINSKFGIAHSYNNLGLVYIELHEFDKAMNLLMQSLEIRQAINHIQGLAEVHRNLGILFRARGEYVQSRQHLEKSLQISTQSDVQSPVEIIRSTIELGNLSIILNDTEGQIPKIQDCYTQSTTMGLKPERAKSAFLMAQSCFAQRNLDQALEFMTIAYDVAVQIGMKTTREYEAFKGKILAVMQ